MLPLSTTRGPILATNLEVPARNKVVKLMDAKAFDVDISGARYFSFSSDKKVAAFTMSRSGDGQMLDGLTASESYIR
jgi:hypothetical protein